LEDSNPLRVEANAALVVVTTAVDLCFKFILCEGDARNVIFPLQKSSKLSHWSMDIISANTEEILDFFTV
jgi:hypothetical protein